MIQIRFFIACFCLLATGCNAQNDQPGKKNAWDGVYTFFASGGKTVGGSPIMLSMKLTIDSQHSDKGCRLNADGFQTYHRFICTYSVDKNQLRVAFKSYDNGKTVNEIGVTVYNVGQTLFTLEKEDANSANKSARYLARWGAYLPFGLERKNAKDYFEKEK